MFQSVEYQFLPSRYGSLKEDNKQKKWNIIVASIEGFLSGVNNQEADDKSTLLNIINDCNLDIEREGRNPKAEENLNSAILKSFLNKEKTKLFINDHLVLYKEIKLSYLKTIRDNKEKLLEYIKKLL